MKILSGAVLAVLVTLAQSALAGPLRDIGGSLIRTQFQQPRQDRFQRPPQREFRRPEQPPERGQRGDGRLTDEERRDLNRDLDRANREIYKGPPR